MVRCFVLLALASSIVAAEPVLGLKVPEGFTVTQYAGPELANDIYCLHIDAQGRVVVAGKGYVRQLVDTKGTGKADAAVDLIPPTKGGAMGLLWEKETLWVVADGGLWKYGDVEGKAPTKTKPELVFALKATGEHEAHAVKRGPDGSLYWLVGNMAGVDEKTVRGAGSPIKKPVAGCFLKLTDDAKTVHILADGFRNAYDFDFNLHGEPFTFDSDNERDQGLPWFEPTRFYHIKLGGNYGWLNPQHAQTWRKPPYFPDVVSPVFTVGRGSPTGVACYRHEAFPMTYQGGFFFADWTFGKVWFARLNWDGRFNQFSGTPVPFLESTGENGFAPTGTAVCPKTGDLFVSIGGRGTRGAVYRIHADGAKADAKLMAIAPEKSQTITKRIETGKIVTSDFWPTGLGSPSPMHHLARWRLSLGDLVDPKTVGTAWEGYSLRRPSPPEDAENLRTFFLRQFPFPDSEVNVEMARLWAAIGDSSPEAVGKMTRILADSKDRLSDLHYLFVLARFTGKREAGATKIIADYVVNLDGDYVKAKQIRDRHWPLRMTEVVSELIKLDPNLADAIAAHPAFGIAEHLWLAKVPGMDARKAGEAFLRMAASTKNYAWSAGQVEFVAKLPEPARREALERFWTMGGLEDAVILQLATSPLATDADKFLRGLGSLQSSVVVASLKSRTELKLKTDDEIVPLIRALRRFADPKTDAAVQSAIGERLRTLSGESTGADAKAWEAWLIAKHPALAEKLGTTGYDAAKWKTRLEKVDWAKGDAERGKALFAKVRCAACHNGGNATGPSLQGVAKRFSRDDLMIAILDPSRDVSPRYRTLRVTTDEDKVFEGLPVYEATDGIILQTGADTTVRIAGKDIASKVPGGQSLMPAGLLDESKPEEIADLIAYLKSLEAPTP